MTLNVQISGEPNDLRIVMRPLYTGSNGDDRSHKELHTKILSAIEPAVYEAVRGCIQREVITGATVYWDGEKLQLKAKSNGE